MKERSVIFFIKLCAANVGNYGVTKFYSLKEVKSLNTGSLKKIVISKSSELHGNTTYIILQT